MIRNQSGQTIGSQMVNATTGAAFAGTVTVYVTIDGGTQAIGTVGSGVCTSEGNGYYTYAPSAAETNGYLVAFTFTGTGAIPATIQVATLTAVQQTAISGSTLSAVAATMRAIITDALVDIGVLQPGETADAPQAQQGLRVAQRMIDAWGADRLTFAAQLRTTFTLTSGTSTVTLGASGADVTLARPLSINRLSYVVPRSSPSVEVPIGQLDQDSYAVLSIKGLTSGYPLQSFYQQSMTTALGSLFFWPTVDQDVTIALYTPEAVGVPASLNTILLGPPGYAEAFLYQLEMRLCTPFGVTPPPLLPGMASQAFINMKRPNVQPAQLGLDPALYPGFGGGYNVYSDTTNTRG